MTMKWLRRILTVVFTALLLFSAYKIYEYEEIAVREGCSYQAVQKSIAAALKKIRKFLK